MYCTKCGTRNEDTAQTCVQCGNSLRPPESVTPVTPPTAGMPPAPIAQAYMQPMPTPGMVQPHVPNYLVQAILVTIFCCLPAGIVSIVYAAQVNSKLAAGDMNGALESSRSAKMWAWISFGLGAFWAIAGLLFFGLGLAASIAKHAAGH